MFDGPRALTMATAGPIWSRIVEAFAKGSVRVGMLLAAGLGILGLVAIQGADVLQLFLRPDIREGWLVVATIAASVSGAAALWVRNRHLSKETDADAARRGPHT